MKYGARLPGVMLGPAAPVQQIVTADQVKALFMSVKMKTGSRYFGDQLSDYMMLCKSLANYRLSRVKANELNIYARGGAVQVKEHLNNVK